MNKICSVCNEELPEKKFYKNYSLCKCCHSARKVKTFLDDFNFNLIRCKYCRCIINEGVEKRWRNKSYCSEWCYDEDFPPEVKHLCLNCGNATNPTIIKTGAKQGKPSGAYNKLCEECL